LIFGCKVDDQHIIVEMQQWDKQDIVQRFLTYMAVNIALQLEDLPQKHIKRGDEIIEIKDYRRLEATKTLIWLVHDDFRQHRDSLAYALYPDAIAEFIRDFDIWNEGSIKELTDKKNELLKLINTKHRSLNFLEENKLIFMFQPIIIESSKITKYKKWFDFAEKTRDFENTEKDFKEFKKYPVLKEVMNILITKELDKEQFNYLKKQKKKDFC